MSTGIEKASVVGTAATLAALVFPVLPQAGPLLVHFTICLGIGSLLTFLIVTPQSPEVTIILIKFVDTLTAMARGVWWGFCQIVHFLAITLDKLDRVLHKLNKWI